MNVLLIAESYGTFIRGSYDTKHIFSGVTKHHSLEISSVYTPNELGVKWEKVICHILEVEQGLVLVVETHRGFDGNDRESAAWNRHVQVDVIHMPNDYSGHSEHKEWIRYDTTGMRILSS